MATTEPTKSMLIAPFGLAAAIALIALTTRLVVTEWVRLPLVPMIVGANVPAAVLVPVVIVMIDVPLPLIVGGEKLAAAPGLGKPLALNVTVPVNPFSAPTVTAYVAELPGFTVCDEETEIEKSGKAEGTA
jgi:hypothetical protein